MPKRLIIPAGVLIAGMLACNAPSAAVETLPATAGAPTQEPSAEPPTETAAPTITATPTEAASCQLTGQAAAPAPVDTVGALQPAITDYLNAGGSVEGLRGYMQATGFINEDGGRVDGSHDLTGDGIADVLVVANNPQLEPLLGGPLGVPGDLMLYICQGGSYALAYTYGSLTTEETFAQPQIVTVADLTGGGSADVLYTDGTCGAHTCYNTIQGVTWNGSGFAPLFDDPYNGPYPEASTRDANGDGVQEVIIQEGTIGSVGAGPQRPYTITYAWNGSTYVETERAGSNPHPIHVVMDADDLFDEGAYTEAIAAYERAYTDPTLNFYGDPSYWPLAALEAYARFRIMVSQVMLGDDAAAESTFSALVADFPAPELEGGLFTEYAGTFWTTYQQTGSPAQACQAVVASLPEDFSTTTALNEFGYANKYWEPVDVCPARRPPAATIVLHML